MATAHNNYNTVLMIVSDLLQLILAQRSTIHMHFIFYRSPDESFTTKQPVECILVIYALFQLFLFYTYTYSKFTSL